jgi:hypothetical protein
MSHDEQAQDRIVPHNKSHIVPHRSIAFVRTGGHQVPVDRQAQRYRFALFKESDGAVDLLTIRRRREQQVDPPATRQPDVDVA